MVIEIKIISLGVDLKEADVFANGLAFCSGWLTARTDEIVYLHWLFEGSRTDEIIDEAKVQSIWDGKNYSEPLMVFTTADLDFPEVPDDEGGFYDANKKVGYWGGGGFPTPLLKNLGGDDVSNLYVPSWLQGFLHELYHAVLFEKKDGDWQSKPHKDPFTAYLNS